MYTEHIQPSFDSIPEGLSVYISGVCGDVALKVSKKGNEEIVSLVSNQEEAEARIMLHCAEAVKRKAKVIVVRSSDTDVLVLLIHHYFAINATQIFLQVGVKGKHTNNTRLIPVHEIVANLTPVQRNIVLPVYCITGCDTISSFQAIGKKTVFNVFRKITADIADMKLLGNGRLCQKVIDSCTYFVGALYGHMGCRS